MNKSPLASRIPEMTVNVLSVYHDATLAERKAGLDWYPNAHDVVLQWAGYYGRSIANVACVVAALSPQVSWERNLIIADDVLKGDNPSIGGVLHVNLRKAEHVRDERISNLLTVFPGGPKVNSFAANLAGDYSGAVTIDAHAAQAALADVLFTKDLPWAPYACIAAAYFEAARQLGIMPAHLQAIVWLAWKRMYSPETKRDIRRKW